MKAVDRRAALALGLGATSAAFIAADAAAQQAPAARGKELAPECTASSTGNANR